MTTPMLPPPSPRPTGDRPQPPPRPRPPATPSAPALAARAEATFYLALERPAVERAAYIAEACGGDAEVAARVRELLAAHEKAGAFMDADAPLPPEAEAALANFKSEEAGDAIGNYKLREQIGEGGFGSVWVADQEHPVRRRVALKIIKLGMDTKEVIARFEQERQALALMDHPNIARVLDAGATAHGRPYFVMELVRGVKITDYCDEKHLSTRERIELFITICQAVQHAHQKGIIHRDLKPSNILVTVNDGRAVPKVIDFGVAKATQGRLTDQTVYTQFQQMIGTPIYMSPEQAELTSVDIDTRSDIYALGVLLYELLTGHTPIERDTLARVGMDEFRRLIREVDPPLPSLRMKTLEGVEMTAAAKRRNTEPAKLSGTLRGDIDWIVMKCIEKDRTRRYDTANGLALDLQRHLKNEVVIARPPTTAYLLSKLIRRNKVAFAAGAAIAASLVIGIAMSVWQAVRATSAEKRVVAAFDELRLAAPAFVEQARSLAAKEQFAAAIEKLNYALQLRPLAAEILVAKADLLQCQFELAKAADIYREALRLEPGLARAEASAKLCDELLAAPAGEGGKLTRESLAKLHLAMQLQQRPVAELMPVARLLGEEKKLALEYWLARLKDLPVSAERPLKSRLSVREDGRLALDLSETRVIDLSPLAGAPLAVLDVSKSKDLTDLAPLRGIDLLELNLGETGVADLAPLRDMRALEKLEMSASKVADLSPLSTLRLRSLHLYGCPVHDLTPIRKLPLEELNLAFTRVADLSPLLGMPLKSIDVSFTPARDFSPLAQLPLEKCYLMGTRIADLSVLRDKPLKELVLWRCVDARNYAAIAEIKTLELFALPTEFRTLPDEDYAAIGSLRDHPALRQVGAETLTNMSYSVTGSKEVFWQDWDREQTFVPALRAKGFNFTLTKLITGSYALRMENQPLSDLSVLKGAPLSEITFYNCQFRDLAPIRDLKLEHFYLNSDFVADLSPLRGMPLKTVYLRGANIRDLAPLKDLPLRALYLDACGSVTDVALVAEIPTLEKLTIPVQARNIETLRKLPKLQLLAFNRDSTSWLPVSTAEDFWKDYRWISRLREAGITPRSLRRLDDGTWAVDLEDSRIADLALLQGIPISDLNLGSTAVTDLTPLRGMRLKRLLIGSTKVTDLSPLQGMPLQTLSLRSTKVSDLSALRGMPLRELRLLECPNLTDLSALAESTELTFLVLPPNAKNFEFLRAFPSLERLSFQEDLKQAYRPDRTAEEFWREFGEKWVVALRNAGMKYTATKEQAGMWSITVTSKDFSDCSIFKGSSIRSLNLEFTKVTDLSPLADLSLDTLRVPGTPVTDLTPLRASTLSASLRDLDISMIKATDFSPVGDCANLESLKAYGNQLPPDLNFLRGLKLRVLWLARTPVTDISALAGMPLSELYIDQTAITDVSPLVKCPTLTRIILPGSAQDVGALHDLPALERISYEFKPTKGPANTAAEFWQAHDAKPN
jgi:serine/threonine protein kinase/Leucine-rich repeat (LRR) protein